MDDQRLSEDVLRRLGELEDKYSCRVGPPLTELLRGEFGIVLRSARRKGKKAKAEAKPKYLAAGR